MPLTGNPSHDIPVEEAAGKPHRQAVAIALDVARRAGKADGGEPFNLKAVPKEGKKIHVGPIHSGVAGRTDHLPMHVPPDAYVLPADVVGALGEHNTTAGFKVAKSLFTAPNRTKGRPYGASGLPYGAASPGRASGGRMQFIGKGGDSSEAGKELYPGSAKGVPIVAAGGEHVIGPDEVLHLAKRFYGDDATHEDGHKILDEFVKAVRAKSIKTLQKLPGPKKD